MTTAAAGTDEAAVRRTARLVPALTSLAGALLTYAVSSSGLVYPAYLVDLQVGVLVGIVAGTLADGPLVAAACAAAGVLVGVALGVSSLPPDVTALLTLLASSAVVAAGVRALKAARPWTGRAVLALGVLLAVANVWATAWTLAPKPLGIRENVSLTTELNLRPPAGHVGSDDELYREMVWTMRDGESYYDAVGMTWKKLMWGSPGSLFDVRQPTMFTMWAALPGWPMSALAAYLAVVTIGMIAAPIVISRSAPIAAGVTGSAAVGAYLLSFTVTRRMMFMFEPWTGALAVAVFAAVVLAQGEKRHRTWMTAAAALAFVAMISRELMLYLMLAGVAASFAAPRRHRRFDLAVWLGSLAAALAYWGVHASRARALITGAPRLGGFWMQNGGFDYLWKGVTQFTPFVSPQTFVVVAVLALGIIGALLQPDRQFRVFASAAVLMPLVGFLFVGNVAMDTTFGNRFNYWGAIVLPAAYALAPSALLLLSGLRRPATAQATEEEPEGAESQERMTAGA